ncbi:hypothetical protein ABT263_29400 [Kitasatospora sp. NPDC001603]|uniref:hypothetical protein n=1 Tax=Kitasatospora sp. NPDC001603 TaxID=3154388 RepID=UPI0033290760
MHGTTAPGHAHADHPGPMTGSLPAAVTRFLDNWPQCRDPRLIHDQCHEVSKAFAASLAEVGVSASVVSGAEMEDLPDGGKLILRAHFAVRVGEDVYDWTARQFDAGAPVPLVAPYDEWRQTWKTLA